MERPDVPPEVEAAVASFPYPLLFATVSGAHLYGFPSPDSDWDVRGCHLLPLRHVLSLDRSRDETCEVLGPDGTVELDVVSHDVGKFLRLMRKPNGYVLEQVGSPLVLRTGPAHEELSDLARRSVSRRHAEHYLGFARSRRRRLDTAREPSVKVLLYAYRALLTGVHLMRSGRIVAHLPTLLDDRDWPDVDDLVLRKRTEAEQTTLGASELPAHERRLDALAEELDQTRMSSPLPETVDLMRELDDLVYRLRLAELDGGGV